MTKHELNNIYVQPILERIQCLEDMGGPDGMDYLYVIGELIKDLQQRNRNASETIMEEAIDAIRNILNGLYALRDHARMDGPELGTVEQRLIYIGIDALKRMEAPK